MKVTIRNKEEKQINCMQLECGQFAECVDFKYGENDYKGAVIMGLEDVSGPDERRTYPVIVFCPKFSHLVGTEFANTGYLFEVVEPIEFIFEKG